MLKRVKLWFVIRPNGEIYENGHGDCVVGFTRKKTIESVCWDEHIWRDVWQPIGYTCRRLDVEVPDGK